MSTQALATRAALALAPLLALLAGGCAGQLNDRPVLDGSVAIPSVTPPPSPVVADPAERWSGPGPATTSLDRGDWQRQTFIVPVDGSAHGPAYSTRRAELRGTDVERRGGIYPTTDTALDLTGDQPERVVADAFRHYAESFFDLAMFFPRIILLEPIWSEHQSPRVRYQRRPSTDWRVGPLPATPERPAPPDEADPDEPDTAGTAPTNNNSR